MAGEKNKKSIKRFLTALILFGPAIIFIILTLGHCENVFKTLPDYGEVGHYSFVNENGKVINNATQKGKITIFTTIQPTCPGDCGMDLFSFNLTVFQPYEGNRKKFKDIDIVSIVTDTLGNPLNKSSEVLFTLKDMIKNYDSTLWDVVLGNPKQVYNFVSNGINLYTAESDSAFGGRLFLHTMLLVDKNGHVRYAGRSDKEGYVRDFEQHVALLRQEYKRITKSQKD